MTESSEPGPGSDPDPVDDPFTGPDWHAPSRSVDPAGSDPDSDAAADTDAASDRGGAHRPGRTRIRVDRGKRRRWRRIRRVLYVVVGVLFLGAVWLVVTGLLAHSALDRARDDARTIRAQISAGNLGAARSAARDFSSAAHRAHFLTSGPAWSVAAAVPGLGDPLDVARSITTSLDHIGGNALPELVQASSTLNPATLREADGSINLAPIERVAPSLTRASRVVTAATTAIQRQDASTWLGAINSARTDLLGQLAGVGSTLRTADVAARVLPTMLGANGTQRYFVAFQNSDESRGTGGLPGSYAIVTADNGTITFTRFGQDGDLSGVSVHENYGTDYDEFYAGSKTTSEYVNANVSPHFPYAAQTWADMWQKKSGQHVDGAIALDPDALSYLLAVTGPATLPDGTVVSADNVVALTQKDVYARFRTDNAARKKFLSAVAKAASEQVLDGKVDPTALVKAFAKAASERRFQVWDRNPSIERDIASTPISGVLPVTTRPFIGPVITNAQGSKLDYYLARKIDWTSTGCGSTRSVTATITITNNAPLGLPLYTHVHPGDTGVEARAAYNKNNVYYYATHGASLDGVTIDGKAASTGIGVVRGHPAFVVTVVTPRAKSTVITFHLTEPATKGPPIVLDQPMIQPLAVSISDQNCG